MPTTIQYLTGDATVPAGDGAKVIVHICNDIGGWGRGFVLALSKRWPEPEDDYRNWSALGKAGGFVLGAVRFVEVDAGLWVANLIGQHKLRKMRGVPPVRYDAVREGLERVADFARDHQATVHMPRIGCGLAGGEWSRVETIINDSLIQSGIGVSVYDLP